MTLLSKATQVLDSAKRLHSLLLKHAHGTTLRYVKQLLVLVCCTAAVAAATAVVAEADV